MLAVLAGNKNVHIIAKTTTVLLLRQLEVYAHTASTRFLLTAKIQWLCCWTDFAVHSLFQAPA